MLLFRLLQDSWSAESAPHSKFFFNHSYARRKPSLMPCKGRSGSRQGVWRLGRRRPEARRDQSSNEPMREASRLGSTLVNCSGQYEDNITEIDASCFLHRSFAGPLCDPRHAFRGLLAMVDPTSAATCRTCGGLLSERMKRDCLGFASPVSAYGSEACSLKNSASPLLHES